MIRMVSLVAATLAVVFAQTALVPAAQAQDLWFELWNDTSVTLTELYVSPSNSEYWEEDLLGAGVVFPGEGGDVMIADGLSTCSYDILGVFEDGDQLEDYGVDLCTLQSYTFTE